MRTSKALSLLAIGLASVEKTARAGNTPFGTQYEQSANHITNSAPQAAQVSHV